MVTLDSLFTDYLQSIMPTSAAVKRAAAAHTELRADLETDPVLGTYLVRSLISGSYGRDTAIRGIKDVDIVLQLSLTRDEIRERCRKGETEQACLLRLTKEAIERTGRAAKTRTARRSIHVELPEKINEMGEDLPELTLDIVPVLIPHDEYIDPMTIADKDLVGWYDTYPNTQLGDSVKRNQDSSEICGYYSYKSLVKMLKAWKVVHFGEAKTPKGFILECLAATYHNPQSETWIDAVYDLFDGICAHWPDPSLLVTIPEVHDISEGNPYLIPIAKSIEDARRVLERFHSHRGLISLAREQAITDLEKAAKTLQRVFGSDPDLIMFPLPPEDASLGASSRAPAEARSSHDIREANHFG